MQAISYPGTPFSLSSEPDEYHRTKRTYSGGTNYGQFTYLRDDSVQDVSFGNGLKTSMAYDKRSRPKTITTRDGATTMWSFQYAYDKAGNVLGLSGTGIPTQTFLYDDQDRLVRSTGTAWGTFAYSYDAVGNRKCMGINDCPPYVVLRPNAAGSSAAWTRIGCTANWDCVDEATPDSWTTYLFSNTAGAVDLYNVQDLTIPGSIASVGVFAVAAAHWDELCNPDCPGTSLKLRIQVGANGYWSPAKFLQWPTFATVNHTWTTNPATGQAWTQADVNALQAGIEKYGVDLGAYVTQVYVKVNLGNRTEYLYGVMNELASAVGREPAAFTYTPNGSLATKTEGGTTWTYAYNEIGLLASVKQGAATVAQYFYDGLGRRVKTVEGSTTTYFAYGLGIDPIWEKTGTTETRHIYANGMRIARQVVGGSTYYYHLDALGSTWRITDGSKASVFSTSYEPFGRSWGTSGSLAPTERYRYVGERNDTETGLTYLRARQYDSKTGRFTSMDPVLGALSTPHTLNRYPYALNNPTRYTDPTGEFVFLLFLAAVLIGAALNTGIYAATCGDSCSTAGYVGAALGGAAAGAIGYLTAGAGLWVAILGGAAANMAAYGIEGTLTGTFTWEGLAFAGALGAGFGALGAGARAFGTARQFGKSFSGVAGADDVLGRFWGGLRRTLRGNLHGIGDMRGALAEMRVANALGRDAISSFGPRLPGIAKRPDILLRNGGIIEIKAGSMLDPRQLAAFAGAGRPVQYFFGGSPTDLARQLLSAGGVPWQVIPWYW